MQQKGPDRNMQYMAIWNLLLTDAVCRTDKRALFALSQSLPIATTCSSQHCFLL